MNDGNLRPALFLDRDGTLMEEVDHCRDPRDVRTYPGTGELLRKAADEGWLRIIVTNQSGIGRGYFSEEDFLGVQRELLAQLDGQIDATYMAPDHPDHASDRRKPSPGMILEAAKEHRIDLSLSWMIGDKPIDIECGRRAGVRTILVETGYGSKAGECGADRRAATIVEAIRSVITGGKPEKESHPGA